MTFTPTLELGDRLHKPRDPLAIAFVRFRMRPGVLNDSHIASWIPASCPECGVPQLGIAATADGLFNKQNFSIVCGTCGVEFSLNEILDSAGPRLLAYLPDGESNGTEKFGRGRETNVAFGKGFGSTGKARSEVFRYAIDKANGWEWNAKRPNGVAERDRLYAMKATVGLFENKAMKSTLEMLSRKIERIERARSIKISEAMVDQLAKMIRKGLLNAEARRPTTSRDRRLLVETVMGRMGWWPE